MTEIISIKALQTQKIRICASCNKKIFPKQFYLRLYGKIHSGEKPIEAFECFDCLVGCPENETITAAFEKRGVDFFLTNGCYGAVITPDPR